MTKSTNGNGKDVIYIDVDDEITAIIDKVHGSRQRIVALVLPKRASAFQSIVNMKLLKRSADSTKKNVVLITSDTNLLPLAGDVGLHVAKSLQSKPEVPDAPEQLDDKDKTDDKADLEEVEVAAGAAALDAATERPLDKSKTLAELNGDEEETIELDDIDDEPQKDAGGKKLGKGKDKNKRFKIPDFNRFRLLLLAGVGGFILLIVLGIMAFVVLPKAKVVISTDSTAIEVSQDVKLKTGEDAALDVAQAIVPAAKKEVKKTLSQEVPASGQKNNGETASGSVTMTAKNCNSLATPSDVPAGTGITANGKTYITQKKASFGGSGTFDGSCLNFKAQNITITAQGAGAAFNADNASFAVVGRPDVTAAGSAAGGTDSIVKIVAQADIDSAKQKIGTQDAEAVKLELTQALETEDYYAVATTFSTATPTTNQSANVGDAADNVTVTQEVVYSMLGIKLEDMEKIIAEQVNAKIDPTKQSILDYGFDEAVFTLLTGQPDGATVGFQTTAVAGSKLDAEEIKKQVAGKKANGAEELIKENPGVTDVQVTYSPFWVSSIPKKTGKITVIIEEPQVKKDDAQSESSE